MTSGPIDVPKEMVPMAMNGPTVSFERYYQLSCMGPFLWTKILPMAMNGPTTSPEKCCQYPCVGPSLKLKITADTLVWAHS